MDYPLAVADTPYNAAPGVFNGQGEWKLCLHTTETEGEPLYTANTEAPHLTYNPKTRTWKQHYELDRPSEAVGLYDNYMLIQVEIICYSQKSKVDAAPSRRLWVGNLPDTAYEDIADLARWLNTTKGLRLEWLGNSYLNLSQANATRLTEAEFIAFGGILGHGDVPANTGRWDPGAFNWQKLMTYLEEDDMDQPTFNAWMDEYFDTRTRTDNKGLVYRHSFLVGDAVWRSEVGRQTATSDTREYLSSVLVQARNYAKADFLNGDADIDAADLTQAVADAIEEAGIAVQVADELARRLIS